MQLQREETFAQMYQALYGDIYRFVYQLWPNRAEVSTRVDEIFLLVYRNLKHYQGECSYRVWTFAQAHQYLTSPWRRAGRRKVQSAAAPDEQHMSTERIEGLDAADTRRIGIETLLHRFRQLSEREREVILLQMVYGFSMSELALIMGLGEGSARTLSEQATAQWQGVMESWLRTFVPDALLQLGQSPNGLELAEQQAGGLERVKVRAKRSARRARVLPIAAVAVVLAIGVTAYLMPGEMKANTQPTASEEQPSNDIDLGEIAAELTSEETAIRRMEAYRNNGYQMLHYNEGHDLIADSKGLYIVEASPGQSKVKKKLLLELPGGQIPRIRGGNKDKVILTTAKNEGQGQFESLLLVDLTAETLTPIPTSNGSISSSTVWTQPTLKVVYCTTDMERTTTIVAYDVETGAEQVLHEASSEGSNYVFAEGSTLVISTHHELYVVDAQGKRLIAKSDQPKQELSAFSAREGQYVLYITGQQFNTSASGNGYQGTTKVMKYNIQTGESAPLIGNVVGDQYLISPINQGEWLIGNFLPDSGVKLSDTPDDQPDLPGTTQIWYITEDHQVKLLHERQTIWYKHWFQFRGFVQQQSQQVLLAPDSEDGALLVDLKSLTAKPITTQDMQQLIMKNVSP